LPQKFFKLQQKGAQNPTNCLEAMKINYPWTHIKDEAMWGFSTSPDLYLDNLNSGLEDILFCEAVEEHRRWMGRFSGISKVNPNAVLIAELSLQCYLRNGFKQDDKFFIAKETQKSGSQTAFDKGEFYFNSKVTI
jgi:hypothetical protein